MQADSILGHDPDRDGNSKWQEWHDLVRAFTVHRVERYGLEEVRQWHLFVEFADRASNPYKAGEFFAAIVRGQRRP